MQSGWALERLRSQKDSSWWQDAQPSFPERSLPLPIPPSRHSILDPPGLPKKASAFCLLAQKRVLFHLRI